MFLVGGGWEPRGGGVPVTGWGNPTGFQGRFGEVPAPRYKTPIKLCLVRGNPNSGTEGTYTPRQWKDGHRKNHPPLEWENRPPTGKKDLLFTHVLFFEQIDHFLGFVCWVLISQFCRGKLYYTKPPFPGTYLPGTFFQASTKQQANPRIPLW